MTTFTLLFYTLLLHTHAHTQWLQFQNQVIVVVDTTFYKQSISIRKGFVVNGKMSYLFRTTGTNGKRSRGNRKLGHDNHRKF